MRNKLISQLVGPIYDLQPDPNGCIHVFGVKQYDWTGLNTSIKYDPINHVLAYTVVRFIVLAYKFTHSPLNRPRPFLIPHSPRCQTLFALVQSCCLTLSEKMGTAVGISLLSRIQAEI